MENIDLSYEEVFLKNKNQAKAFLKKFFKENNFNMTIEQGEGFLTIKIEANGKRKKSKWKELKKKLSKMDQKYFLSIENFTGIIEEIEQKNIKIDPCLGEYTE